MILGEFYDELEEELEKQFRQNINHLNLDGIFLDLTDQVGQLESSLYYHLENHLENHD